MRSSKSRSRKSGRNNAPNRSVGNIINRVFDSSGPEGKVRGTPQQIIDKYNQLARDAQLGNDRVAMENFQQHAEHYLRLLAEAQREIDQRREQQERENRDRQSDRDQGQGSLGQGAQGQRDQGRDNNRDNPNRENGNRDNGNRDNDTRDAGQREGGYRETGNRDNRDGGNRDNRDGGNRDNSQREQPRQQNRERNPRNDQDAAERGTDHRRTAQPDVLDLGGESGLVETPESRSEAPAAPAPVTRSEPRAKSEPRSKPRAKAEPRTSADQPALALSDAPAEGADQPKPKPRTRAPRKPREGTTGGNSTSGTPEAAE